MTSREAEVPAAGHTAHGMTKSDLSHCISEALFKNTNKFVQEGQPGSKKLASFQIAQRYS